MPLEESKVEKVDEPSVIDLDGVTGGSEEKTSGTPEPANE